MKEQRAVIRAFLALLRYTKMARSLEDIETLVEESVPHLIENYSMIDSFANYDR